MTKNTGAVLQMEFDVARFTNAESFQKAGSYGDEKPWDRVYAIAKTAITDTIRNKGTFVLVSDGKTITMVQRPEAEVFPPAPDDPSPSGQDG